MFYMEDIFKEAEDYARKIDIIRTFPMSGTI